MPPHSKKHAPSQTQVAPWDALPPELKDSVFASLSLLDLGRAVPTSREFRAAYKARLLAAHAATVQKAASCFGEAVLRAHSTLIVRLFWGVDLFSGGNYWGTQFETFDILDDGTIVVGPRPNHRRPLSVARVSENWLRPSSITLPNGKRILHRVNYWDEKTPQCFSTARPLGDVRRPFLALRCYPMGDYTCLDMSCCISEIRDAAGALAAVCNYIKADSGRPSCARRRRRRGVMLVVQLKISTSGNRSLGNLSEAHLDDIAAALLPLFPLIKVLKFACSLIPDGVLECSSLRQLIAYVQRVQKLKKKNRITFVQPDEADEMGD